MSKFWKRGGHELDLEAELRARRPEPRPEFVAMLAARVRNETRAHRRGSFRLAFAAAFSAAVLTALASVGGLGYAASSVTKAAKAVAKVVAPAKKEGSQVVAVRSAGSDEYRPGYGYGDPNHNHTGPPGLQRQGGNFAPPLKANCLRGKCSVGTKLTIDEQAHVTINVLGPTNKKLVINQQGSKLGGSFTGKATKALQYLLLVPGARQLALNLPANQLVPGVRYRIRIIARDPQGNKKTLIIPFSV